MIRLLKATLGLVAVLVGVTASGSALAGRGRSGHGGHSGGFARSGPVGHFHHAARVGVFIGFPVFAPWYSYYSPYYYPPYNYPPYYYDYPPAYAAPSSPPVYIEPGPGSAGPAQQPTYWYYCSASNAYYPYVSECPGGWQRVAPQPPPS